MDRQTLALLTVIHNENECMTELMLRYIYAMNPDVAERLVKDMREDWDKAFKQAEELK